MGGVSEAATRVTGRRVIQYIIDAFLASIIPGIAYWLLDRGSLHWLGWLIATVISVAVYYWYWVMRPHGHGGQTFGMQLFGAAGHQQGRRPGQYGAAVHPGNPADRRHPVLRPGGLYHHALLAVSPAGR